MKPGIWLFLLLVGFCLCCECDPVGNPQVHHESIVTDSSYVVGESENSSNTYSPINFQDAVWLYLAEGTSVDLSAFEKSGGKTAKLFDSEGNIWDMSLREGVDSSNLIMKGFVGGWFPSYGDQQFFCKTFPATPAPVSDPMIDGPAMCSVYLIADEKLSIWLRRNADSVPCPDAESYKNWLPLASTASPANSLL